MITHTHTQLSLSLSLSLSLYLLFSFFSFFFFEYNLLLNRAGSGLRHVINLLGFRLDPQNLTDGDGFTFVSQGKPSQLWDVGELFYAYWTGDGDSNDADGSSF